MLVHMTPGEVGGLQALAMAHGGSLSINPNTGLPEAGFLKNLLPTLIGAGLMLIPGVNAVGAGLITGGIETARTGDIGKGFLAGLGAFGGANLAGGLMQQAGTSAAASAAGGAGAAGAGSAGSAGLQFADAASPEFLASQGAGTAGAAGVPSSLGTTINPVTFGDTGAAIYGGVPSQAMQAANLAVDPMAVAGDSSRVLTAGSQAAPTFSSNAARLAQGTKNLFTQEGAFDRFVGTAADKEAGVKATGLGGGFGAARTVGLAAAPALMAGPEYAPPSRTEEESNYEGPYTPSERRVAYPDDILRRRTSEYTYFTPSNPVPFDEGGKVEEDRSIKMPDASYVAGQMPEFSHGFKAVEIEGMPVGGSPEYQLMSQFANKIATDLPANIGGKGSLIKKAMLNARDQMGDKEREKYAKMEGYEYDPRSQRLVKGPSSSGGLPALARGGSVPTLEDGGFVLTKKAVDGLGKGNNKKGQRVASAGLGAIPIKGAGAKRGPKAGVDDKIKTTIDGKRPALVSNGEAYVPKKQVAKKGGAKAFYALMSKAEKAAEKRKRA
jgi:hypothetical protein